MDVDQQGETVEYPKSAKTTTSKTAAKPFKIPRPANSFMLYRAENGKKYPGLVATELSAKLGEAWRREPQDVRDRYDEMAEQAKRDHALKYPGYKFAPVKRGTGKRALKLAAEAIANEMAEMDAAALLISLSSMTPATGPTPSGSRDRHQRQYVPIGQARPISVAATEIRPRAQRPFKVASLNKSNVPISNDANVSSACMINVWFGVTEELRERYEIMAESDPRFKEKSNYVNHSQISGTPTTASEAMMANQIAQLLKKAAAGEQLVLPHSNKRKGSANTASGQLPAAKLARLAPASFSLPTERIPAPVLSSALSQDTPAPSQDTPAPLSSTPPSPSPSSLSPPNSKAISGVPAKAAPDSVPDKMATVPSRNDLAPVVVVPMPMASPNKRQTRASVTLISMRGYSRSISETPSSRSPLVAPSTSTAKASTGKKAVPPMVQKEKVEGKVDEMVTPANRPVRRVTRPPRYPA
ncbi:hypothetical protein BGX30_012793 [Mortierella sp. GBA39]|nr:hypothetical protein BGX30_012793 [Mortierella sp. GBA39]